VTEERSLAATSEPRLRTNVKDDAVLVFVPGGEFIMGSDDFSVEHPPHRVWVDPFWIGRTAVSNTMYRRFQAEANHRAPDFHSDKLYNCDDQPIVGVDYDDAVAYCHWAGGRLPTEAEWEFAARGTDGRRYPWGNAAPDQSQAVYGQVYGKGGKAAPVGSTSGDVSPFGVLDMAGNVLEWCSDWFAHYPADSDKPLRNPAGPPQGNRRVMRGGCWAYQAQSLRVTERFPTVPHQKVSFAGFRMVVDATVASGRSES